jgi:pimeloyl-ACP methyl ester carboxylesterase
MDDASQLSMLLPDGRRLGYAEAGPTDGRPLLYFHGTPGSRMERHPETGLLDAMGVRLIALERPGYGISAPQPARQLSCWPADVAAFADWLGIDEFAVLGFSGGGPYALACARYMPKRITATVVVSSPAPYAAMERIPEGLALFELARDTPRQASTLLQEMAASGDRLYNLMSGAMAGAESRVMGAAALANMYRRNMDEAVRQGVEGMALDMALIAGDWGFDVAEIADPVDLWHGLEDSFTPPSMGRYLEAKLPNCRSRFLPGEGHFLLFPLWRDILTCIVSVQPPTGVRRIKQCTQPGLNGRGVQERDSPCAVGR